MNPFKTIMVCLDLTEMDETLIRYASDLCQSFNGIEKVSFVHNIKFDYPDTAKEILQTLDKPLEELLSEVLLEKVNLHFENQGKVINFEVIVKEHFSTPRALASLTKTQNIDLVIAGKKVSYEGSGKVIESLLRQSNFQALLLLVPEAACHQIKHILVPIDFSKAAESTIELGSNLQQQLGADLQCQHVFNVPAHYFPYIPVENMEGKLKENAKKQWGDFVKSSSLAEAGNIECIFTYNNGKNTAQAIYDYALQQKKDLIIMSTKGKGSIRSLLIGSVAIRLIYLNEHIPLLIKK